MASRYGIAAPADITGLGSEFSVPSAWSDADVLTVVEEMEDQVDQLTRDRWDILSRSYILDGTGKTNLYFAQKTLFRCLSITSVSWRKEYDYSDTFAADGEAVAEDSYRRHPYFCERLQNSPETRRYLTEQGVWERGRQNYKITGTWGHSSVPKGIKRAVVLLVRERITPGSTEDETPMESEQWSDYKYVVRGTAASRSAGRGIPILSGYPSVDRILSRFTNKRVKLSMVGGSEMK